MPLHRWARLALVGACRQDGVEAVWERLFDTVEQQVRQPWQTPLITSSRSEKGWGRPLDEQISGTTHALEVLLLLNSFHRHSVVVGLVMFSTTVLAYGESVLNIDVHQHSFPTVQVGGLWRRRYAPRGWREATLLLLTALLKASVAGRRATVSANAVAA